MSRENVEGYWQAVDAFDKGDFDALLALMDEDVEVFARLAVMEGGYQGHVGVRRWWRNLHEAFPDWHAEPVEIRDCGDSTLTTVRVRGHGGESGAPVDQTVWQLAEWRNAKIVRISSHGTEADALEAVGLSE